MAIVLDTGSVSRGSGNAGANRERDIRRAFVESDIIESILQLPENLFYNTPAPGIVMIINLAKAHPGEVLLMNGSQFFVKGRPKNELSDHHIELIHTLFSNWRTVEQQSAVVSTLQIAQNDYNLSPSRYVAGAQTDDVLPLDEAVMRLRKSEEERLLADEALWRVIEELGIQ
jgi:type I restriction enzyme M protein